MKKTTFGNSAWILGVLLLAGVLVRCGSSDGGGMPPGFTAPPVCNPFAGANLVFNHEHEVLNISRAAPLQRTSPFGGGSIQVNNTSPMPLYINFSYVNADDTVSPCDAPSAGQEIFITLYYDPARDLPPDVIRPALWAPSHGIVLIIKEEQIGEEIDLSASNARLELDDDATFGDPLYHLDFTSVSVTGKIFVEKVAFEHAKGRFAAVFKDASGNNQVTITNGVFDF